MLHVIEATPETCHDAWDVRREPVVRVSSGDTVRFVGIPDVGWGVEPPTSNTAPRRKMPMADGAAPDGPALCGPVFVEDAMPGMMLEIHVERVVPSAWGFTWVGDGITPSAAELGVDGHLQLVRWTIDREARTATADSGHRVRIAPFPGMLGLARDLPGRQSAWPPRRTGGNLDCRLLTDGSVLHVPIEVEGAMLSAGDGHAAQGDGEIGGTAIECMLESLEVRLVAREHVEIEALHIRTPTAWAAIGLGDTLDDAALQAMDTLIGIIQAKHAVNRHRAVALASAAADLRATQVVNGIVGVHAMLEDQRLAR